MADEPDIVAVDKLQKKAVMIYVVIPCNTNIKKKEQERLVFLTKG